MQDIVKNTYNKIAQTYAGERDAFPNIPYLEKFIALLSPGATILDLGCGAGAPIDRFLVDKGFKVIGVDLAEKQIELAKKSVPEATYQVKDMSELQPNEYSVDAVISFYAIFHIPRKTHKLLFQKIHSFLKPNGIILVTMASTDWEGIDEDFYGEKMYESHYAPEVNSQIVKEAGFNIILDEIDTSGNEKHQVILAKST